MSSGVDESGIDVAHDSVNAMPFEPLRTLLVAASTIQAGDTLGASDIVDTAQHLLDTEDMSSDDRRRLYKLRKKWTARSLGLDTRWKTQGSKPGRPLTAKHGKNPIRNEEQDDPLLASIIRKFGTPID